METVGIVERITRWEIDGWAYLSGDISVRPEIVLLHDGKEIARTSASTVRDDLETLGLGRSDLAFRLTVPEGTVLDLDRMVIRSADLDQPLPLADNAPRHEGVVESRHGNLFRGWAWRAGMSRVRCDIHVYDGDRLVAQTIADEFRDDIADAGIGDGRYGFTVDLGNALGLDHDGSSLRFVFAEDGAVLENMVRQIPILKPCPLPL